MTESIVNYISNLLIHKGVCLKENESILKYGLELVMTSIIGVMFMVVVSLMIRIPFGWLFFILGFAPLRTTAGGYHATTHFRCYTISTIIFLLCIITVKYIELKSIYLFAMILFSFVIVLLLAPIEAKGKPLKKEVREKNRKKSLIIITGELIMILVVNAIGFEHYMLTLFCLGIFFASISLVASKINKN